MATNLLKPLLAKYNIHIFLYAQYSLSKGCEFVIVNFKIQNQLISPVKSPKETITDKRCYIYAAKEGEPCKSHWQLTSDYSTGKLALSDRMYEV